MEKILTHSSDNSACKSLETLVARRPRDRHLASSRSPRWHSSRPPSVSAPASPNCKGTCPESRVPKKRKKKSTVYHKRPFLLVLNNLCILNGPCPAELKFFNTSSLKFSCCFQSLHLKQNHVDDKIIKTYCAKFKKQRPPVISPIRIALNL